MKFRNLLLVVMGFAALAVPSVQAQKTDRGQWMDQLNQYRRSYFTKELELSGNQQSRFFELYEEMIQTNDRIEAESRTMRKRIADAADATDLEYEKAAEALYDAQVQEAQVEKEYMVKFKEILTPKQLFEIKNVEKKFSREMMRQHSRLRHQRAKVK